MKSKDQILLEEAYQQVSENILSKLNPFAKKTAAPQQAPVKQETPQQEQTKKGLMSALETLIRKSNVDVSEQRVYEGDKHDSDIYSVNGKKVIDVMLGNPPFIQIIDKQGKTEKVDAASGAQGLDKIYNALKAAGAAFDTTSEDLAYSML